MCTLGRPWTTPTLLERLQTQLSHQTPETSSATVSPLATQHLLEPASAISAPALVKDRFYLLSQHFVLQAPGTLGFEGVVVEPCCDSAQRSDTIQRDYSSPVGDGESHSFCRVVGFLAQDGQGFF
jgi:hypothetical protein